MVQGSINGGGYVFSNICGEQHPNLCDQLKLLNSWLDA